MSHRRLRFVAGLVALAMVGGLTPAAAASPRRELLHAGGASYPRVIRLEHNGPANGRILASVGTVDGSALGIILESTDVVNGVCHAFYATGPISGRHAVGR